MLWIESCNAKIDLKSSQSFLKNSISLKTVPNALCTMREMVLYQSFVLSRFYIGSPNYAASHAGLVSRN